MRLFSFSIMISSDSNKFILAEDGSPLNYEKKSESFFDFELLSSGKVKDEVLKTIQILKKNFKTDDLSLLNDSYDLWMITKLLKTADAINNVDISLEMIDTIKMSLIPIAMLTPYGSSLNAVLGGAECGFKLFKKYRLNVHGNSLSTSQELISCTETIIEMLGSSKVDLGSFSIPKLIRKAVDGLISNKIIGNVKIRKGVLDVVELFTGVESEKLLMVILILIRSLK